MSILGYIVTTRNGIGVSVEPILSSGNVDRDDVALAALPLGANVISGTITGKWEMDDEMQTWIDSIPDTE